MHKLLQVKAVRWAFLYLLQLERPGVHEEVLLPLPTRAPTALAHSRDALHTMSAAVSPGDHTKSQHNRR